MSAMPVSVERTMLRSGRRPALPPGEAREWLAGKGSAHVPTATAHTSMVVNQIIHLLEESQARTHYARSEHFTRALMLWEAATRRAEMDEWLDLCEGMLRGLNPLAKALARLAHHASSSYEDALGSLFMMLNLGEARRGQFFTPFPVARMLAEMTLQEWLPPYGPAGPPATFYEPACGSGVMFLGTMAVLEERFPEQFFPLLQQGLIVFRGVDLDQRSILMTTLNLRLRGYPLTCETLTLGDALRMSHPESVIQVSETPPPDAAECPPPAASPSPVFSHTEQYLFF